MTTDDHWVGDIGHLALADAMLGSLLIDMLQVLSHAEYPALPKPVNTGMTTKAAASAVRRVLDADSSLCPDGALDWAAEVIDAAELRHRVLHAITPNRCVECGAATQFVHPRSGQAVDRSDEAVRALTAQTLGLRKLGAPIAVELAARVNARIVERAAADALATGEIQNPRQVHPSRVTHTCANCSKDGQSSTVLHVGAAVAVLSSGPMEALIERYGARQSDEGDIEE